MLNREKQHTVDRTESMNRTLFLSLVSLSNTAYKCCLSMYITQQMPNIKIRAHKPAFLLHILLALHIYWLL